MSSHDNDPRHNHPTLTWDRMSTWQRKQYGVKPAPDAGLAKPARRLCSHCKGYFNPIGDQPYCNSCGPLDANGKQVYEGDLVRIARWQTATAENGAETRTGEVYKIAQQSDKRWILYMKFPPAPYKRDDWCSFSYGMVLVAAPAPEPVAASIGYEQMPTAAETKQWAIPPAQRKLLAKIINKPRYCTLNGKDHEALEDLSGRGLIHAGTDKTWRATPSGYGLLANPLPEHYDAGTAEYWRARNWGRVDRLPTQSCANCRKDYTPVVGAKSDCCPTCVLGALAKAPAAEPAREGWASTRPGFMKYHHYNAQSKSECGYQHRKGELQYPESLTYAGAWEFCRDCKKLLQAAAPVAPPRPARAEPGKQLTLF